MLVQKSPSQTFCNVFSAKARTRILRWGFTFVSAKSRSYACFNDFEVSCLTEDLFGVVLDRHEVCFFAPISDIASKVRRLSHAERRDYASPCGRRRQRRCTNRGVISRNCYGRFRRAHRTEMPDAIGTPRFCSATTGSACY